MRRIALDRFNKYTVSTADTPDHGLETCIFTGLMSFVVEYYDTDAAAVEGHKKWVLFVEKEPTDNQLATVQPELKPIDFNILADWIVQSSEI